MGAMPSASHDPTCHDTTCGRTSRLLARITDAAAVPTDIVVAARAASPKLNDPEAAPAVRNADMPRAWSTRRSPHALACTRLGPLLLAPGLPTPPAAPPRVPLGPRPSSAPPGRRPSSTSIGRSWRKLPTPRAFARPQSQRTMLTTCCVTGASSPCHAEVVIPSGERPQQFENDGNAPKAETLWAERWQRATAECLSHVEMRQAQQDGHVQHMHR